MKRRLMTHTAGFDFFFFFFCLTKTSAQSAAFKIVHLIWIGPIQSPGNQRNHKPHRCFFIFLSEKMQACTVSVWSSWTSLHLLVKSEPFTGKNLSKSFSPLQVPQVLLGKVPPQHGLVIAGGFPLRAGGWGWSLVSAHQLLRERLKAETRTC